MSTLFEERKARIDLEIDKYSREGVSQESLKKARAALDWADRAGGYSYAHYRRLRSREFTHPVAARMAGDLFKAMSFRPRSYVPLLGRRD